MSVQVKGSPFDLVRRCQTPKSTRNFPDTEEVTGSNPVRPTMTGLLQPVTPPVPAGRSRFHDQLQQVRSEEIPRQNFIFGAYCQRKLNSLLNATRTAIATADPTGPNHRDQVHWVYQPTGSTVGSDFRISHPGSIIVIRICDYDKGANLHG